VTTELEPTVQHVGKEIDATSKTTLDYDARLGMWMAAAESKSKDPKALGMAAALRIAFAREAGLPAYAASEVYVINGTMVLSSKAHRALAWKHGIRVLRVDETPESCTAVVVDASGKELGRTTFTMAQAKKMGLSGTNWQNNPDRMLWARASKRAIDDHAPWVSVGVMTAEEARDAFPDEPVPFDSNEVLEGVVEE
jgi:hypothetical protein